MLRRFDSCGCNKDAMKCIKNGFAFVCDGRVYNSDLYLHRSHGALHIDGCNPVSEEATEEQLRTLSRYDGGIIPRSGSKGDYLMSDGLGVISLNKATVAFLEKWEPGLVEQYKL